MVNISIVILSILTVVYFALSLSILITSVSLDKQIKDIKNVNIDIWIENCSLPLDYNQTIGHYDYNISSVNTTENANITGVGIFRESYYYTTISWGSSNTSIYRYLNYTNGTLIIDENAELDFWCNIGLFELFIFWCCSIFNYIIGNYSM